MKMRFCVHVNVFGWQCPNLYTIFNICKYISYLNSTYTLYESEYMNVHSYTYGLLPYLNLNLNSKCLQADSTFATTTTTKHYTKRKKKKKKEISSATK